MTITPTAPSVVTPCPIQWCPSAGHHEWNWLDHPSIEPDRSHTLSVQDFISDDGGVSSEVAVDCYETRGGVQQTMVELFNGHAQLLNRDEVNELVASIQRAADLAFGPAPLAEQQAEFDAAAAEVIVRAGTPTDVNRLIAAALRLRTAHAALVEADVQAATR